MLAWWACRCPCRVVVTGPPAIIQLAHCNYRCSSLHRLYRCMDGVQLGSHNAVARTKRQLSQAHRVLPIEGFTAIIRSLVNDQCTGDSCKQRWNQRMTMLASRRLVGRSTTICALFALPCTFLPESPIQQARERTRQPVDAAVPQLMNAPIIHGCTE